MEEENKISSDVILEELNENELESEEIANE